MFPTYKEVVEKLPDADQEYTFCFDETYDEQDEKCVQKIWGPVRLLTLDLAARVLPLETPIVFLWGDFLCYDGEYGKKSNLLSTVKIRSFGKNKCDWMIMTVDVMDGLYRGINGIQFRLDDFSKCLTYGTGSIPVYVYV